MRIVHTFMRLAGACLILIAGADCRAQPIGWSTAAPITVTENSGAALTGYQLRLTLDTATLIAANEMNADGSDLRFGADQAGSTQLPYYLDSGINTASTVVWVKLDALPASSSIGIWMFYGNPAAASASTVDVFDFTSLYDNSATNQVSGASTGGVTDSQRGFRFSASQDILVTDFGKNEPNGSTRYVTLFDFSSQAILAQTQVSGPAAQYSYASLAQPVWLTAGTQYLIEIYQGDTDGYYFGAAPQVNPLLTYYDMRYCNSCTQNTFPTNALAGMHYGYVDFEFRTHQQVTPAPTYELGGGTVTTVSSVGSPSAYGQPVTLTANVTGPSNPGGSVSFYDTDGFTLIAGCTNPAALSGSNPAVATCVTSALTVGTHSISASYSGDANNLPSVSTTFSQEVIAPHAISGTVGNLAGAGLSLHLDFGSGTEDLPIASGSTTFAFVSAVPYGATYSISVGAQPTALSQICQVTNDSTGSMPAADVTDVQATCVTSSFTVSGSISGLSGSNLQLQINGGDTQAIGPGATSFAFSALVDGTAWSVTVTHQPNTQTCNVTNSSGTLAGANVTNVAVTCATNTYSIGGSINGLSGSNLHLQINGGNTQTIAASATSFVFSEVPDGTAWTVSVAQQPDTPTQTCNVVGGAGTLAGANVNNLNVNCTTNTYTVGGSVSGLTGAGLTLLLNGGTELAVSGASFTFPTPIHSGSNYLVSFGQQPSGQTCSLSNASGTVTDANVINVAVSCAVRQAQLTLTIDDGHDYARYGQMLDYLVTLTNTGDAVASNVSVTSNGTGLDLASANWQCAGGGNGAVCTTSGVGALVDTVTLPPNRSVTWVVSAPVVGADGLFYAIMEVNATGAASVADYDTAVIFRDAFDVANGDGARAPIVSGADISGGGASQVFVLPAPSGNRIDAVETLRSGRDEIRVERITLAGAEYVRVLQHAANGAEHASAWTPAQPGAVLSLASVAADGQRVVLLEGGQQSLALHIQSN